MDGQARGLALVGQGGFHLSYCSQCAVQRLAVRVGSGILDGSCRPSGLSVLHDVASWERCPGETAVTGLFSVGLVLVGCPSSQRSAPDPALSVCFPGKRRSGPLSGPGLENSPYRLEDPAHGCGKVYLVTGFTRTESGGFSPLPQDRLQRATSVPFTYRTSR